MCSVTPFSIHPAIPQDRQQRQGRIRSGIAPLDSLALDHCLEPVQVQVIAADATDPAEAARRKQVWEEDHLLTELQCEV